MCTWVYGTCVPVKAQRECWMPGTGITGGYEPPWSCWELNLGPLLKQTLLLTTEPFMAPTFRNSNKFKAPDLWNTQLKTWNEHSARAASGADPNCWCQPSTPSLWLVVPATRSGAVLVSRAVCISFVVTPNTFYKAILVLLSDPSDFCLHLTLLCALLIILTCSLQTF